MNAPLDSLLEILDNGAQRGARSVPVLMPVALDQTYDYLVPDGIDAAPGAFVDYVRYLFVADGEKARQRLGFAARHSSRDALTAYLRYRHPHSAWRPAEATS